MECWIFQIVGFLAGGSGLPLQLLLFTPAKPERAISSLAGLATPLSGGIEIRGGFDAQRHYCRIVVSSLLLCRGSTGGSGAGGASAKNEIDFREISNCG
jgi:hypothetical protein